MSFVIGISQGIQPIIGYNYGAKLYHRVKRTYLLALGLSVSYTHLLNDAIAQISWTDSTGEHHYRELDNQLTFDYYYGVSTQEGSEAYNNLSLIHI